MNENKFWTVDWSVRLWVVNWRVRPVFITKDFDDAMQFAKKKGYEVISKHEDEITLKHKTRRWSSMTIRRANVSKEISMKN